MKKKEIVRCIGEKANVGYLLLVLLVSPLPLYAQTYYVRSGGTGAKNGSDWANALSALPASLTRGATYYLATGSYPAYTFATAVSGTTYITVKKAVATDHGTETGWDPTYGTGQAVFTGGCVAKTGYVELNGQFEYGIKIDFSEGQTGMDIQSGTGINLRYIDLDGVSTTGNYNYTAETKCIYFSTCLNTLVSHCALHGGESLMQDDASNKGTVIEYCHLYNARSIADAFHANVYFCTGSNGIFRFNRIHDYNAEGLFFTGWQGPPHDWQVYGNVFWSDGGEVYPRGIELRQDYNYSNIWIYNNTFVGVDTGGVLNRTGETGNHTTGCQAVNNLAYNTDFTWGDFAVVSANTVATSDPFVNAAAKDFRLKAATTPGSPLGSPYNADMLGSVRGADGVWDRGAYEYTGIASTNPVLSISSSALIFGSVQVGGTADLTISVKNSGGGTLSGSATTAAPFSIVSGGTYSLGSNQTQTVAVRFSPISQGSDNGVLTFTGGGGGTASLTGSAFTAQQGLSFAASSGTITAPFSLVNGVISQSVETDPSTGGRAVYAFSIADPGNYTVSAYVNGPNSAANSLYINIDSDPIDPTMIWDIPVSSTFQNQTVSWRGTSTTEVDEINPKVFNLSAGQHTLIIIGRESNVQLGSPIQISLQSAAPSAPTNLRIVAQ